MEIEAQKLDYVSFLPIDIWNLIAQFLSWEEQEEFIARMEKEKDEEIPEKYYQYFPRENNFLGNDHILGVFSPDKNKIALFEKFCGACGNRICGTCKDPQLMIIDLQAKKEEDKIIFGGSVDKRYYRAIAVASSGTMYAVIKKETKDDELALSSIASHRNTCNVLVLHNIIKNKKRTFEIPDDFIVSCLLFNKQGTQVIVYASDYRQEQMRKNYLIFEFKKDHGQFIVDNKSKTNRLLDYFNHCGVCKNYGENKKTS